MMKVMEVLKEAEKTAFIGTRKLLDQMVKFSSEKDFKLFHIMEVNWLFMGIKPYNDTREAKWSWKTLTLIIFLNTAR